MDAILAVDFGSTFTKAALLDRGAGEVVAVACAPSTVESDVNEGLDEALALLRARCGFDPRRAPALAASSAAGGLRVAVIGLVPRLSLEAAQRAALGAGAKIVSAHGYRLTAAKLAAVTESRPDIVLLAGGTDGGDEETILHNARVLADHPLHVLFIVAGNEVVSATCVELLERGGKSAFAASNILPEVGRVEVRDVHDTMRELFIAHIVRAKGLDRVCGRLDLIADIIPTPSAVLEAARLIAEGTAANRGLGDTVVVDIGGATTDVHSVASGAPTRPGVMVRGLPEARLKRTVEGDLGMRVNAQTIVERCGADRLLTLTHAAHAHAPMEAAAIQAYAAHVAECIDYVPSGAAERAIDTAFGRAAVALAMRRHAGSLREVYTPMGPVQVQEGKDLSEVAAIIGVGGVLAHGENARFILEGALDADGDPFALLPRRAALYLDRQYVLYGIGLLAALAPDAALAIARQALVPL